MAGLSADDVGDILKRAVVLGAAAAGVAAVEDLRRAPSFALAECGRGLADGHPDPAPVVWPEGARSVVVLAVAHPASRPEMDWWYGRADPPGNRVLAAIVSGLCEWITAEYGVATSHLPYHVERGGIYLKDAAVLAGLGRIGRNNLLVTPEHGPCVRLRALTLDADLASTGPCDFDPCAGCPAPCRSACPRGAFGAERRGPQEAGATAPPAAGYSRAACHLQMHADMASAAPAEGDGLPDGLGASSTPIIRYCRACELDCPVGMA